MKKNSAKLEKSRIEPRPIPTPEQNTRKIVTPHKPTSQMLGEFKAVAPALNILPAPREAKDAPHISGWRCTGAWVVELSEEESELWEEVSTRLGNVRTLYHGTATGNIPDIAREGLLPGRTECMFGKGIYMGPPAKAFGYTSPSLYNGGKKRGKRRWFLPRGSGDAHYILEVKAALGRVYSAPHPEKFTLASIQVRGFDSVGGTAGYTSSWGGTLRYSENVVYSPDQVIVTRIFEYQKVLDVVYETRQKIGACGLYKVTPVEVGAKNRAFKDLISKKVCGAQSVVQVALQDGRQIYICNKCIEESRLKVGSTVEIKDYRNCLIKTRIRSVLP